MAGPLQRYLLLEFNRLSEYLTMFKELSRSKGAKVLRACLRDRPQAGLVGDQTVARDNTTLLGLLSFKS